MTDNRQLSKVAPTRKEKDSKAENQAVGTADFTVEHPLIVGVFVGAIVSLGIKTPIAVRFLESDAIYFYVRKGQEEADAEALTASVLAQGGKPYLVVINRGTPDETFATDLTVGEGREAFHIIGMGRAEATEPSDTEAGVTP